MTDAHCHPFDCMQKGAGINDEPEKYPAAYAASSWNREQFDYHYKLSQKAKSKGVCFVVPCFGVHPQLTADKKLYSEKKESLVSLLGELAAGNLLGAVGETGFDLYGEKFKAAEKEQDELFSLHLETALKSGLPMVIHSRRAMHKIFSFSKELKKLPSVIFHSWPGTTEEGEALIRRGINVFFSFGVAVLNNHKEALRSAARLPVSRILFETDAPYQPPRGKLFSSWDDLAMICETIAAARREPGATGKTPEELEAAADSNFRAAFNL